MVLPKRMGSTGDARLAKTAEFATCSTLVPPQPQALESWFQEVSKSNPSKEDVENLISQGINVSAVDSRNRTALHLLCKYSAKLDIILMLIEKYNAKPTALDSDFSQPLHYLAKHKPLHADSAKLFGKIIDYMLNAPGGNVNAQNMHQETPLQNAVRNSNIKMVEILIDRGADIFITNKHGATVLHYAVAAGKLSIVERFLDLGIDPLTRGGRGTPLTVLEMAKNYENTPLGHKILEVCQEYADGDKKPRKKTKKKRRKRKGSKQKKKKTGEKNQKPEKYFWEVAAEELDGPLEMIGAGGFGLVYKGTFRKSPVAVKKLEGWDLCTEMQKKALIEDFKKEVDILSKLRNKNVIQFYGACLDYENEVFILTEWADNGDLYHFMKKNTPDWKMRVKLMLDAARGLVYLHENKPPVLHRDLKSLNILIDCNYVAKLCDFGLSKITEDIETEKEQSSFGSLKWVAPEIFDGKSHTKATDMYSFGIVLYEAATMKEPWFEKKMTLLTICNAVLQGERPSLEGMKVDADFRELMEKCWASDPAVRPSVTDMFSSLEAVYTRLTSETGNENDAT